jgi:hypothetical protein
VKLAVVAAVAEAGVGDFAESDMATGSRMMFEEECLIVSCGSGR